MVGRKISRCHNRTRVTKEERVLESDNRIMSLCTLEELAYICADYFVPFPPVPSKSYALGWQPHTCGMLEEN